MKKFDLHIHTKYSRCSNLKLDRILKVAKKMKLDGISVSDHDQIIGAKKIYKINKDKDFEVIISEEVSSEYGHFLVLFVNELIKYKTFEELLDEVKKQDALLIPAHPFDDIVKTSSDNRKGFDKNFLLENYKKFDAIETFNSRSVLPWSNNMAKNFARKFRLAEVGGSDAHFWFEIGRGYTLFNDDLRKAIKNKRTITSGTTLTSYFGHALSRFRKTFINPKK